MLLILSLLPIFFNCIYCYHLPNGLNGQCKLFCGVYVVKYNSETRYLKFYFGNEIRIYWPDGN